MLKIFNLLVITFSILSLNNITGIEPEKWNQEILGTNPSELHKALLSKDFQTARSILSENKEEAKKAANFKDTHYPKSSMHGASELEAIQAYSKKFNKTLDPNYSVLELAIQSGAPIDLIEQILQLGADVNGKRTTITQVIGATYINPQFHIRLTTPLAAAIKHQNIEVIHLLLDRGANFDEAVNDLGKAGYFDGEFRAYWNYFVEDHRQNAFHLADTASVVKQLIYYQNKKQTPLENITEDVVNIFMDYEKQEHPALHQALLNDDFEAFETLLNFGKNPYAQEIANPSLFELVLESSNPNFFQSLVNRGYFLEPQQDLLNAAKAGNLTALKFFLEKARDQSIDLSDSFLKSLFQQGIQSKKLEIVQYLVEQQISDKDNAIKEAIKTKSQEILEFLLKQDFNNENALINSIKSNEVAFVEMVLSYCQHTEQEIDAAIEFSLNQKKVNKKILDLLYSFK